MWLGREDQEEQFLPYQELSTHAQDQTSLEPAVNKQERNK